jgi:hypothetical protein
MPTMTSTRDPLIISDDIPSAFLAEMLLDPGSVAAVFSEEDAVLEAEVRNQRSPHPKQYHPQGRPRRGRAVR